MFGAVAESQQMDVCVEPVSEAQPPKSYAFEGAVIRLTDHGYSKLKKANSNIEDFDAMLEVMDAFYASNPDAAARGWYWGMCTWLRKENAAAKKQAKQAAYGTDWM